LFTVPRRVGRRLEGFRRGSSQGVSERECERDWSSWPASIIVITTLDQIKEVLELTPEKSKEFNHSKGRLAMAVTPYLRTSWILSTPIVRSKTGRSPGSRNFTFSKCDMVDPLGRGQEFSCPGLVHRYPDRVLSPGHRPVRHLLPVLHRRRTGGSPRTGHHRGGFR